MMLYERPFTEFRLMSVSPSYPSWAKTPDFRRADRIRGLVIVGLTFVLCLLLSFWVKRRSQPEVGTPPAPPTTVGLVGFPKLVDVEKALPLARALTRRNLLRGITADWVDRDGHVNVTTSGQVQYAFQSAPGQGPQPHREPGALARRPYCGRQTVSIKLAGLGAEADNPDAPCAAQQTDPLPEPRCTLAEVWAYAVEHGEKGRFARIEYYRAVAGPAWRFTVAGVLRFTLYGDCKRELSGREAANVGL